MFTTYEATGAVIIAASPHRSDESHMPNKLESLKARLAEVDDLENAAGLLEWDQLTMMPPAGADGRAAQMATLQKIAHEKFTSDEVGQLLDDLSADYKDAPAED